MKHVHTAKPNEFVFKSCRKGHGAMDQRVCSECGKEFCRKCQSTSA